MTFYAVGPGAGSCAAVEIDAGGDASSIVIAPASRNAAIAFNGTVSIGSHRDVAAALTRLADDGDANLDRLSGLSAAQAALNRTDTQQRHTIDKLESRNQKLRSDVNEHKVTITKQTELIELQSQRIDAQTVMIRAQNDSISELKSQVAELSNMKTTNDAGAAVAPPSICAPWAAFLRSMNPDGADECELPVVWAGDLLLEGWMLPLLHAVQNVTG